MPVEYGQTALLVPINGKLGVLAFGVTLAESYGIEDKVKGADGGVLAEFFVNGFSFGIFAVVGALSRKSAFSVDCFQILIDVLGL